MTLNFILDELSSEFNYNFSCMAQGDEVSMIIVLPDEIDGLSKVEKKLETFSLDKLRQSGALTDVELSLPKFKIESKIDLNDVLIEVSSCLYLPYLNPLTSSEIHTSHLH